jgi:hypothetical protein
MTILTDAHARLIADAPSICRIAGVPWAMVEKSATEYLPGPELDFLRRYPHHLRAGKGLLLTGKHKPGPDTKLQAMGGAFLRNFIDARVMTVQALLDIHDEEGSFPDPTVLLIPNLHVVQKGKALTAWMNQLLYDLLVTRRTSGRMTIAYVESLEALGTAFGSLFRQHLEDNYIVVDGK